MNLPSETATKSQADRAYALLRTEILHGGLMPGQRLRAAELQQRFAIGLTPIREALMRLEVEGLVAGAAQRGFRVSEASRAELADLTATRRDIERLCLRRAIERGDTAWEAEIVAAMHLLSRAPLPASAEDRDGAQRWEVQHRRFHGALVAACGSAWLLRFWTMLADQSERYRKIRALHHHSAAALVRDVEAEHRAIMEAVLARAADRATELMDAHLLATERAVLQVLESVI